MAMFATQPVKKATLALKVIRKSGAVEDLGVASYWHSSRICRWWFAIEAWARRQRVAHEQRVN